MKKPLSPARMLSLILKKRVALLSFAFFLSTQIGLSQNQKIDSLNLLLSIKSGVERIDLLFELTRAYADTDYTLSFEYAGEAYELSKQIKDTFRIVRTGRAKSQIFRRLGEIDSSIILLNKVLPIARSHNYLNELKPILNGLGLAYTLQANFDKALRCFFESLELREKDGDKFEIGVALNNIGLVYYNLEDYDRALTFYNRSFKLRNETSNRYDLDVVLLNISLCYAHKGNFPEAQNFVKRSFATCGKNCSEYFLTNAWYGLGVISFEQKNFSKAEIQFLQSYSLARKLGDKRFHLDNMEYLIRIYLHNNQLELVEKYLKEAETLISSGMPYNQEMINLYARLFLVYTKSKNFEKVAFYQGKYIELKDSIYTTELTTNLMKVEAEHLEKENKAKIDSQNKILALKEEVISRQRFLNVFIGIVSVLLVALAIVLLRSNRQKKFMNKLLDEKVKERTQELEMNRDILQRACEERDILIHKTSIDIRNSLATLKGLCSLGLKDIEDPRAQQYINKMNTTSDNFSEILGRLHLTRITGEPKIINTLHF